MVLSEEIVGKYVEFNICQFLEFNLLDIRGVFLEKIPQFKSLVGYEDDIGFLLEEFVHEEVEPAVGAGAYCVEIIDDEQEIGVCVFIEGVQGEHA